MRKKLKRYTGITIITLLFPFLFTLIFTGKIDTGAYEIEKSGQNIIVDGNGYTQTLDIEEFIPCVLMSQMSADSPKEALKAQAVVIRTYIYNYIKDNTSDNATFLDVNDIAADDIGLEYVRYGELEKMWGKSFYKNYNKLNEVIGETASLVIKYNDKLIVPFFHFASAGKTRDGQEVFGGSEYPYLASVNSKNDFAAENYLAVSFYTEEEFMSVLGLSEYSDDTGSLFSTIEITNTCSAGYALKVSIGGEEYSGEDIQKLFNLNSSCFAFEITDNGINIVTKGIGHGLGLSIQGAINMATEGSSYEEILNYYYKDIEIEIN